MSRYKDKTASKARTRVKREAMERAVAAGLPSEAQLSPDFRDAIADPHGAVGLTYVLHGLQAVGAPQSAVDALEARWRLSRADDASGLVRQLIQALFLLQADRGGSAFGTQTREAFDWLDGLGLVGPGKAPPAYPGEGGRLTLHDHSPLRELAQVLEQRRERGTDVAPAKEVVAGSFAFNIATWPLHPSTSNHYWTSPSRGTLVEEPTPAGVPGLMENWKRRLGPRPPWSRGFQRRLDNRNRGEAEDAVQSVEHRQADARQGRDPMKWLRHSESAMDAFVSAVDRTVQRDARALLAERNRGRRRV